jgi:hypothetical protein
MFAWPPTHGNGPLSQLGNQALRIFWPVTEPPTRPQLTLDPAFTAPPTHPHFTLVPAETFPLTDVASIAPSE